MFQISEACIAKTVSLRIWIWIYTKIWVLVWGYWAHTLSIILCCTYSLVGPSREKATLSSARAPLSTNRWSSSSYMKSYKYERTWETEQADDDRIDFWDMAFLPFYGFCTQRTKLMVQVQPQILPTRVFPEGNLWMAPIQSLDRSWWSVP